MSARAQAARGYRLKPAARSRPAGRRSRIQWDKVGRVALVLVLFAILASYVSPSLNLFDAWRNARSEHAALTELRAEHAVRDARRARRRRARGAQAGHDAAGRGAVRDPRARRLGASGLRA